MRVRVLTECEIVRDIPEHNSAIAMNSDAQRECRFAPVACVTQTGWDCTCCINWLCDVRLHVLH